MERIESIDTFKIVAILAVIIIHATPFKGYPDVVNGNIVFMSIFIDQLSRFAVPFFFAISGYFWGIKIRRGAPIFNHTFKMTKRIFILYLAWSLLYLLPYNISNAFELGILGSINHHYVETFNLAIYKPVLFIMQGTTVHLWFLISLIFSAWICALFVAHNFYKSLGVFALALYTLGLISKAYIDTPVGFEFDFDTRNGPFLSTLLFASGYYLSGRSPKPSWLAAGSIIFILGSGIHIFEIYYLWRLYDTYPIQDYVIGTYLAGIGFSIAALSNHQHLKWGKFSSVGRYTLGIYAIHYIFVDMLAPIRKLITSPFWEIGYVIIVFLLSVAAVMFLAKSERLKAIVA